MDRFASYPLRLLTDLYQFTMLCAYARTGKADEAATFRLYFRRLPFRGGFALAAGLAEALGAVKRFQGFSDDELHYLRSLPVFRVASGDFWQRLKTFRFTGSIDAIPEGTLVFPEMPLLEVRGPLFEAQLIESLLLCMIGFPTLVATEAAHACHAARGRPVFDFGMRRAQGPDGAIIASRAAYIGGVAGTSNVAAGMLYGIPVIGTHAHSFVQSFDRELDAFHAYADLFPDDTVLLVDTVDTLQSGVPNAAAVGKRLAETGHQLRGIRLDSGDLVEQSRSARGQLDAAGLQSARIVASNDLDPPTIERLLDAGAQLDAFGVGTRLATSFREPALGCVYKLVELSGRPRVKRSSQRDKQTIPGRQHPWRLLDSDGRFRADCLLPASERPEPPQLVIRMPHDPESQSSVQFSDAITLLEPAVVAGEHQPLLTLEEARRRAQDQLARLPIECRAVESPRPYLAGISESTARQIEKCHRQAPLDV